VKRISVGDYPEGIETSADGNGVYVVNWFSNEVWAINTESLKVTAKMPAGDGPRVRNFFARSAVSFSKVLLALRRINEVKSAVGIRAGNCRGRNR
jgi:YVTN family beta-propeller protein